MKTLKIFKVLEQRGQIIVSEPTNELVIIMTDLPKTKNALTTYLMCQRIFYRS